ncbi:hypothetical protein [Chishuiella sp.]|uniref:hypothetical protein n=1 Tax=Chishuiella sp. TaxID=1969467 RepID=UPI0028ADA934|nr:hypothetical protein [Chishuiella sp.]
MNYQIRVNKWIDIKVLSIINDYLLGIENRKFEFSREMICEKYNLTINDLDTLLESNLSVLILTKKCKKCETNYHTSFVKRRDIINNLDYVPIEIEICKDCQKKIDDKQKAINEQKIQYELAIKIKNETKNNLQFALSGFDSLNFEKIINLNKNILFEKGKSLKIEGVKLDDDGYLINIK